MPERRRVRKTPDIKKVNLSEKKGAVDIKPEPEGKPEIAKSPSADIPKLTLKSLTSGIALAALNAKKIIDFEAAGIKKEYEKNELLRNFPVPTFELSEIEVELNFLIEDVEKDDVVIVTDAEKLSELVSSASKVRFKLTSKTLSEYILPTGEKVIRD